MHATHGTRGQQAFVFSQIAVVARHWYEVGESDEEHGARIEILRRVTMPHRGTESTAQGLLLDGLIWRVDLFDVIGEEPGRLSRAHHHVNFEADGATPIGRDWDQDLTADPFGWTEARLRDISGLITAAGLDSTDVDEDTEDVRRAVPVIMAAARSYAPQLCVSPDECRRATRDTAEVVQLMASQFRGDATDPRARRHA